jgi:DNA-binding NtrC family response regulator
LTQQPNSILIVDDDDDIRQMLAEYVQALGFLAVEASQGESAVDMMDHGYEPKLIISDVNMPIMDGTSFLKVIHERYPDIPFVILTGVSTEGLGELARGLGAVEIFEKPCDMTRLGGIIKKALAKR